MKKLLLLLFFIPQIGLGQYSINEENIKLVKNKSDILIDFIWEMKYSLVFSADAKVFLDLDTLLDNEEDFDYFEVPYSNLPIEIRGCRILDLQNKSNRNASNQFVSSGNASKLKSMIEDYKAGLLILSNGDKNMIKEILSSLNTDDLEKESWERYNFYDMPAVGSLTLLSKWQADVRGIHLFVRSHISDMLQENGGMKLKLKDYYGAIKDYSKSIKYDSCNFISYNNRGTVKYILKDYKGAIEDFSVAISLSPETTSFYVNRGNARLMIKDYNGCLEDFYKAIEIDPIKTDQYMNTLEGQKYCNFLKNFCELGEEDCCNFYDKYCNSQ